jgi:hypothetical protein
MSKILPFPDPGDRAPGLYSILQEACGEHGQNPEARELLGYAAALARAGAYYTEDGRKRIVWILLRGLAGWLCRHGESFTDINLGLQESLLKQALVDGGGDIKAAAKLLRMEPWQLAYQIRQRYPKLRKRVRGGLLLSIGTVALHVVGGLLLVN